MLVRKVDANGDGQISWDEFRDAFRLDARSSQPHSLPSGEMPGGIFYSAAARGHTNPTYRTSALSGARGISAANPSYAPPTPAARFPDDAATEVSAVDSYGESIPGSRPPHGRDLHLGSHNKSVWSTESSRLAQAQRRSQEALRRSYRPLSERTPFGIEGAQRAQSVSRRRPVHKSRSSFGGGAPFAVSDK